MSRGRVRAYLPPEHGAWALLLVPYLLGTFSGTPTWASVVLLVAWLTSYLSAYYLTHWWRSRNLSHRGRRFRRPALTYAAVFVVSGCVVVALDPWTLFAALAFVPFEAVALAYAITGRERHWVAGVASATAASLMAPLAYRVASGTDTELGWALLAICWWAFVGAVLHVKSTIRERDDRRFRVASVAFHTVSLPAVALIDPWLLVPFGYLWLRAVLVPRHGWPPARIGMVEIVGSTLVLSCSLWVAATL